MNTTSSSTEDNNLEKGKQAGEQSKPDDKRPETVTPDNENGMPGKPEKEDSSNKGKGPAGENL